MPTILTDRLLLRFTSPGNVSRRPARIVRRLLEGEKASPEMAAALFDRVVHHSSTGRTLGCDSWNHAVNLALRLPHVSRHQLAQLALIDDEDLTAAAVSFMVTHPAADDWSLSALCARSLRAHDDEALRSALPRVTALGSFAAIATRLVSQNWTCKPLRTPSYDLGAVYSDCSTLRLAAEDAPELRDTLLRLGPRWTGRTRDLISAAQGIAGAPVPA